MGTPYIGEVRMFAGNFAPAGWAFCNGTLLPISEYDTLFALIGTTYGGDGQSTFALPDLRGRLPVHSGTGPGLSSRALGESGGVESVVLLASQLPMHSHEPASSSTAAAVSNSPSGRLPGNSPSVDLWIEDQAVVSMGPGAVTVAGGSQPHNNEMPFLCVSFIISLFGIFPSQN